MQSGQAPACSIVRAGQVGMSAAALPGQPIDLGALRSVASRQVIGAAVSCHIPTKPKPGRAEEAE